MEVKQVTLHKKSEEVKLPIKKGVLTAETVTSCVSQPGCCVSTGLHHYHHHMPLSNRNLTDVSILCKYVHIHKLELQNNKIKDLSCVSHMPFLAILDASHNEISDFFGFQPPKNLKDVNFSHNCMTKMKDLSAFSSLSKLNLDNNCFREICGLEQCCKLTHLSLAHNNISRISGLDNMPLIQLCLKGNKLMKIEGLENQNNLQMLDLSLNQISSLSGLQNLHVLGLLNLEKNKISEIEECKHIHNLLLLRDVNLLGNQVQELPDYRLSVVFLLQHLSVLDQEKVTPEEKVSSVNKYDPPLEVVAARDHMTHLVYLMMQPQVLYDSTLPSADSPYPMLVLTGPQCCGKRELAHRLCQDFSEYFAYGICHTTRGAYFGEENGVDYHFVSEEEFQNMILMGKFIQTVEYGGHHYGLTRDAIEEVAREGLACCVHMELEGVLSLKNSYFEPRYILLIPTQVEKYIGHLRSRDLYTPAQIDQAVSRIELYANTNRHHPGFFDNVIVSDDFDESYQMLRQVVKAYLLLEEHGRGEDNSSSPDTQHTDAEPKEKPPSDQVRLGLSSASHSAPALNPTDLCFRHYWSQIQTQLNPQKSPAELVSLRRREQLVRDAIVGKSPGVYSHLFRSSLQTGPSSLQNQNHNRSMHLSEDSRQMFISDKEVAPVVSPTNARTVKTSTISFKHVSPSFMCPFVVPVTSSSDESCASSVLSVPSSAGALSGLVEPLDSSVQGHTLETRKEMCSTPEDLHPDTDQMPAFGTPSSEKRPGSNMKTILPPIPPGRRTPVAPSPAPSLSQSPAAGETEKESREV